MMPVPPALAYRHAAAQQASAVGLVIALLDTLAGDLKRAAASMESKDIEDRVRHIKHGFSVLTQLDSLVDAEHGGQTAAHLRRFYAYLRAQMLSAQFQQEHLILVRLCSYVLDVRGAWQELVIKSSHGVTSTQGGLPATAMTSNPLDCLA